MDNTNGTFIPDDTRRQYLEGFIGTVCVGSTGRLGIVTHVAVKYGDWTCCGLGLDGKGVWTSGGPTEIAGAEAFFDKLNNRFDGKMSYHDMATVDYNRIADLVVEKLERTHHSIELGSEFATLTEDVRQNGIGRSVATTDDNLDSGDDLPECLF